MKWHPDCKYMEIQKDYSLTELAKFHGHLGPNIVLGYRMGKYICDNLCDDPFQLNAVVYCSGTTPESCVVDGVQLGTGCTLGKGNIAIVKSDAIKCEFTTESKGIRLIPKPLWSPENVGDDYELKIEKFAVDMYNMDDSELFEIEEL